MALNYPAFFEISQLNLAKDIVAKAAISLGIFNGALHCECMINDNGIFLIEMGARGGGGHIFGQIVEAVSGVRMPVALVRLLMGKKTTVDPQRQRGACYKFFNAPQGVFKDIIGLKTARNMAGVLDMGFELKPGTQVDDISSDANRPGFVVTTGETRKNAIEIAHQAISSLKFVMN
jgi:biotin carboxylase